MQNAEDILRMLDCTRDGTTRKRGIELASELNPRLLLKSMPDGRLAQSAADALERKSDAELEPYLAELLEWVIDILWPGSWTIVQRLKVFRGDKLKGSFLQFVYSAKEMNNEKGLEQLDCLSLLLENEELKAELKAEQLAILEKHFDNWAWWWQDEKWKNINNVDEIMGMLHWDNSGEVQRRGVELGKRIKMFNAFLQPYHWRGSKGVWGNCAEILTGKSDEMLRPYLKELLEWLQDLNWPGALNILNRLKTFSGVMLRESVVDAINKATASDKEKGSIWLGYLSGLLSNEELKAELPKDKLEILQKHCQGW